jgi:hypothetical protein
VREEEEEEEKEGIPSKSSTFLEVLAFLVVFANFVPVLESTPGRLTVA